MKNYRKELDAIGNLRTDIIVKIQDEVISYVPCDDDNKDYKEYLEWLAEGNTPLDPE